MRCCARRLDDTRTSSSSSWSDMGGMGLRLSLRVCLSLRLRLRLRLRLSLLLVLLLSGGDRGGVGRTLTLLRLTCGAACVKHTVGRLDSVLHVDGSSRRLRRDGVRVNRRLRSDLLRLRTRTSSSSLVRCTATTGRHGRVCETGRRALEAAVRGSGRLSGRSRHDRDGRLVRERDGAERAVLVRPGSHQRVVTTDVDSLSTARRVCVQWWWWS